MLQRIPVYRDPLVELVADALKRALVLYRSTYSNSPRSATYIEFECRLGTYSPSRHNCTQVFHTRTTTPAVLDVSPTAAPFFFFAGVAPSTFKELHNAMKRISPPGAMPPKSSITLSVRTSGQERLEYAMNPECSDGHLIAISEKERLFTHDVRCPAWAADFRLCVSRERTTAIDAWDPSKWKEFTPKVSRLRQRKSVRVSPLLNADLSVVRSFTDHTHFEKPWGPQLRVPLVSAPHVSYDVELEVNMAVLHREVRRTRLLDSTVLHTAKEVLAFLQFMAMKRE
ncbi:putative mRNA capping enzyme beta chain [Trypanosoma vivax]|nr:putative mRNA capping enzyme beta chain [Trypanosoma vivax]